MKPSPIHAWLVPSTRRVYPASAAAPASVALDLGRGGRSAFQVATRVTGTGSHMVDVRVEAPEGLSAGIRRVGYVPVGHLTPEVPLEDLEGVGHLPGLAPDPLFPGSGALIGPEETQAFWVTVNAAPDAAAGPATIRVEVVEGEQVVARLGARVTVHDADAPALRNFPVVQWFYCDALCDHYQVDFLSDGFWKILRPYLRNLTEHGQDTVSPPLFTLPTGGVKRPLQLLKIDRTPSGEYDFGWRAVAKFVREAQACGVQNFEWPHLATQWGAENAIRIYRSHGETGELLWDPETRAESATYRDFLAEFLPRFRRFLQAHKLVDRSFFHISDEPYGPIAQANYVSMRDFLRERAPWMRIMDAINEPSYVTEGIVDFAIPQVDRVADFTRDGVPSFAYYCCVPRERYLNRLIDTPLVKIAMSGWIFHRTAIRGFLHWGYNYWYRNNTQVLLDPYRESAGGQWPWIPHGDPFVVYPGADGPVDSIRWEVFAESLRDLALLRAAAEPSDSASLREIRDFAEFPRSGDWIVRNRRRLLRRVAAHGDGARTASA